jgi:tetratricopeptide (TPR) repeat protein
MESQSEREAEREFNRALTALASGNTLAALAHLERALKLWDSPAWYSYLGYCVAKERGQLRRGLDLCLSALERDRNNPAHYLNLGKIHLVAGNKEEALRVLREGMAQGGSDEVMAELAALGMRKPPVIASLHRNHPLNKYLGLILSRLGLR